jgi:beta-mannosidase
VKTQHDLSKLEWKLSGWIPELWRMDQSMEIGASPQAEIPAIPAKVPGSVQAALREAGIIPDWNVGLNFRECEWVENRHWIYEARIPDEWIQPARTHRLRCLGLDYSGEVYLNRALVSEFRGSHVPHTFDLTPHLSEKDNILRIIFETPPRWLGQFGYTSRMKEWKVRFNYTWDWTVRLVQIGIWDSVSLEVTDGREIAEFRCTTDADPIRSRGSLTARGEVVAGDDASVEFSLTGDGLPIRQERMPALDFNAVGLTWTDLPVALWWPNMQGDQPLYDLTCRLLDEDGTELDSISRRVGFKHVNWLGCEGAPEDSDPWICEINNRPVFLQGVNWVPVLPNFADITEADYRKRLELYRDLGLNVLRVWGGAIPEKQCFYDMCDELGIMVWQEFPLSSSGVDNYPPDDEKSIAEMAAIAETYIARKAHHVRRKRADEPRRHAG